MAAKPSIGTSSSAKTTAVAPRSPAGAGGGAAGSRSAVASHDSRSGEVDARAEEVGEEGHRVGDGQADRRGAGAGLRAGRRADDDLGVGDGRVQRRGGVADRRAGSGRVVLQRHHPDALAGGGRERALHLEGVAELGDAEDEDDEQRKDEGELHRRGAALVAQSLRASCSPPPRCRCSGAAAPAGAGPLRRSSRCAGGRSLAAVATAGRRRSVCEERVELVAEQDDGRDDRDGDQADHEAVLDGGGALLLATQTVLGEGDQADEGGVRVHHVVLPEGCRPCRTGSGDPASRLWEAVGTESPRLERHPPARRTSTRHTGDDEHQM